MPRTRKTVTAKPPRKSISSIMTAVGPLIQALPQLLAIAGPLLRGVSRPGGHQDPKRSVRTGIARARKGMTPGHAASAVSAPPQTSLFATPASFAVVQNNPVQGMSRSALTHSLGFRGERIIVSQPGGVLNRGFIVRPPIPPSPDPVWVLTGGAFAGLPYPFNKVLEGGQLRYGTPIDLNPLIFGYELGLIALGYKRFKFNSIAFNFTSSVGTDSAGSVRLCYESDTARPSAFSFETAGAVFPNLTFPFRIPQARFEVQLPNTEELFYIKVDPSDPSLPSVAETRQEFQGSIYSYGRYPSGPVLDPGEFMGSMTVDIDIELYDPVVPDPLSFNQLVYLNAFRERLTRKDEHVFPPSNHTLLRRKATAFVESIDDFPTDTDIDESSPISPPRPPKPSDPITITAPSSAVPSGWFRKT